MKMETILLGIAEDGVTKRYCYPSDMNTLSMENENLISIEIIQLAENNTHSNIILRNNRLSNLDLSSFRKLNHTWIDIGGNPIESIDVTPIFHTDNVLETYPYELPPNIKLVSWIHWAAMRWKGSIRSRKISALP